MNKTGKQWEGQVVDGRFCLQKFLGKSDHSIVFLTEREGLQPQKAAIKLIAADPGPAEGKLAQWAMAATVSHPHILQVFESGRCQIGELQLLYVVMECADENLSEILPQRHLSAAEAQEMLPPVLNALAYLHGQGLVHGHLKPSNIMATADKVKLSGDSICPIETSGATDSLRVAGVYDPPEIAGGMMTPAADVWSLGVTLAEVSALRLAAGDANQEPEPLAAERIDDALRDMVSHCLNPDAKRRWTIAQISTSLNQFPTCSQKPAAAAEFDEGRSAPPPRGRKSFSKWLGAAIAVAGLMLAVFVGLRMRHPQPPQSHAGQTQTQKAPATAAEHSPIQSVGKATRPIAAGESSAAGLPRARTTQAGTVAGQVRERVLPNVPWSARRTIQGHIRIGVRVAVDATGNVVSADLDSPGPSEYFARLAREAARRWTFSPARVDGHDVGSEWILRFAFSRLDTDVRPTQVAP